MRRHHLKTQNIQLTTKLPILSTQKQPNKKAPIESQSISMKYYPHPTKINCGVELGSVWDADVEDVLGDSVVDSGASVLLDSFDAPAIVTGLLAAVVLPGSVVAWAVVLAPVDQDSNRECTNSLSTDGGCHSSCGWS